MFKEDTLMQKRGGSQDQNEEVIQEKNPLI